MERYFPISSSMGRIQQILLVLPGIQTELARAAIDNMLEGIISAFPEHVEIVLLVRRSQHPRYPENVKLAKKGAILREQLPDRIRLIIEPESQSEERSGDADRWAQDPFLVQQSATGAIRFLEPYYFNRAAQDVADKVAANLHLSLQPCPYFLEGGNLFISGKMALIGADLLYKNLAWYFPDQPHAAGRKKLEQKLQAWLGVEEIFWVGLRNPIAFSQMKLGVSDSTYQPFYHLDLFLTPGETLTGKPLFFVADPADSYLFGTTLGLGKDLAKLRKALEEVRNQLENNSQQKFTTTTLPLPMAFNQGVFRTLYAYNNAHVEIYRGNRKIYFPSYAKADNEVGLRLRKIESEVKETYRKQGFSAIPVRAKFDALTKKLGALHCMVKVLKREKETS